MLLCLSSLLGCQFLSCELHSPESNERTFDVRLFGARGDGRSDDTKAIQRCIDAAARSGGGVIVLDRGVYVSGALFFRPGTSLHVSRETTLKGSGEILDYPLLETRMEGESRRYFAALVNADGVDGFSISGEGTIDGSGYVYWKRLCLRAKWRGPVENLDEQRPRLIYISNSKNVKLTGVTLRNAAFWNVHLYRCEGVLLENMRIFTEVVNGVSGQNPDAVDVDGARNVVIRKVYMDVPNDAVSLKGGKGPEAHDFVRSPQSGPVEDVLIEGCEFGAQCTGCLTLGSECVAARRIVFRDSVIRGATCALRLKMRPDTVQEYLDVKVESLRGTCGTAMIVAPYASHRRPEWKALHLSSVASNVVVRVGALSCSCAKSRITPSADYRLVDVICE